MQLNLKNVLITVYSILDYAMRFLSKLVITDSTAFEWFSEVVGKHAL